jgi:hypothetical protein
MLSFCFPFSSLTGKNQKIKNLGFLFILEGVHMPNPVEKKRKKRCCNLDLLTEPRC